MSERVRPAGRDGDGPGWPVAGETDLVREACAANSGLGEAFALEYSRIGNVTVEPPEWSLNGTLAGNESRNGNETGSVAGR